MEVSAKIIDGSLRLKAGAHEAVVADPEDATACQSAIDLLIDNATGGLRHRVIMAAARAVTTSTT